MSDRGLKIYVDGGCRPNPGRMEAAVVIRGIVHLFADLGIGSAEDAEWLALIRGLALAQRQGETQFILVGDAIAVIDEANRALTGDRRATGHAAAFAALARSSPPARIRWVRRSQNLAGIALAARHPR